MAEKECITKSHVPPALNKFMHPRNPYRTPPSFKQLASLYPQFRKFCTYDVGGKVRLDFSQPQALAELAITLLHKDFGLTVSLPHTRLVPTIPLRLNYLLWLQDIMGLWAKRLNTENFDLKHEMQLQQQQKQQHEQQQNKQQLIEEQCQQQNKKSDHKVTQYVSPVIGLDIGCGASCVYGLLGASHCGFKLVATETDAVSLTAARDNVHKNGLEDSIRVEEGSASSLLNVLQRSEVLDFLASVRDNGARHDDAQGEPMDVDSCSPSPYDCSGYLLDFTMCNPPFFSSEQDADSCAKTKKTRGPPPNAHTGATHETVVDGGEVTFITQMIQESVIYKDKIRVFSTLVGSAADLKRVRQAVAAVTPLHTTTTEFCQGRTMRWGMAWSWCPAAPLYRVVSKKQSCSAGPLLLPWPRRSCLSVYTVAAAWEAIDGWLREIKLKPKVFKSNKFFVGASLKAYKATWQKQRQKRREELRKTRQHSEGTVSSPSASSHTSEPIDMSSPDLADPSQCEVAQDCKRMLDVDGCSTGTTPKKPRLDESYSSDCHGDDSDDDSGSDRNDDEGDEGDVFEVSSLATAAGSSNGRTAAPKQTGKPCLVKASIHVKVVNGQVLVEMVSHGGEMGRDGANQLLTMFRNKMQRR